MLGNSFSDISECVDVAAVTDECVAVGDVMWSGKFCKCCTTNNASDYVDSYYWDIFSFQVITGSMSMYSLHSLSGSRNGKI